MRKSLKKFAEFQEKVLKKNDNKDGWDDCSFNELCDMLRDEMKELRSILKDSGCFWFTNSIKYSDNDERKECKEHISKECADVSNFAMMIYDNINK